MSSNPIVLITGGNTGLGFETIRSLFQSKKTYTIVLGGRSIDKANAAAIKIQEEFPQSHSVVKTVQIDIEDDNSIAQALKHVTAEYGRVDILINNAGASFQQELFQGTMTTREAWNKAYSLNTTSTHVFTEAFVPLLLKSGDPKLLFIASGTATLAEHELGAIIVNQSPPKGWPKPNNISIASYRCSKTGMNMMMREWARILKEDGIRVWAISPGFLATGLGGSAERNKRFGAEDPTLGADFIRDVVEGARDADVGKVVRRNGVQPW